MPNVTIYTSPICAYCSAAKRLLSSLGMPYKEINLWDEPNLVYELKDKYHWQTVPMIFIDDEFIGGYDDIAALHRQGLLTKKLGL